MGGAGVKFQELGRRAENSWLKIHAQRLLSETTKPKLQWGREQKFILTRNIEFLRLSVPKNWVKH